MIVSTFRELISSAIKQEEEAGDLYKRAAEKAPDDRSRQLLSELALEELEHGRLLAGIREDKPGLAAFSAQKDSARGNNFLPLSFHEGMSFTEILIYAIKKEENACLFYRKLAESVVDPQLVSLINYLADIEHTHKKRLEEYFSAEVDTSI